MNCLAGGSQVRRNPDERTFDDVVDTDPAEETVDFFLPVAEDRLAGWVCCFLGFDLGLEEDMVPSGICLPFNQTTSFIPFIIFLRLQFAVLLRFAHSPISRQNLLELRHYRPLQRKKNSKQLRPSSQNHPPKLQRTSTTNKPMKLLDIQDN
jgi:hypothetical protein